MREFITCNIQGPSSLRMQSLTSKHANVPSNKQNYVCENKLCHPKNIIYTLNKRDGRHWCLVNHKPYCFAYQNLVSSLTLNSLYSPYSRIKVKSTVKPIEVQCVYGVPKTLKHNGTKLSVQREIVKIHWTGQSRFQCPVHVKINTNPFLNELNLKF